MVKNYGETLDYLIAGLKEKAEDFGFNPDSINEADFDESVNSIAAAPFIYVYCVPGEKKAEHNKLMYLETFIAIGVEGNTTSSGALRDAMNKASLILAWLCAEFELSFVPDDRLAIEFIGKSADKTIISVNGFIKYAAY